MENVLPGQIPSSATKTKLRRKRIRHVINDWQLYVMAIPAMVLLFLFSYLPMAGLLIAFKHYEFDKGIFGSPFMKPWYRNFEILFKNNPMAFQAIKNTLFLNAMFIVCGTAFALLLAIAFNELRGKFYKRLTQSLTFLPFFISTVVVGIFIAGMLGTENGTINGILVQITGKRINFYMRPDLWPAILLIINIWKGAGYSAIVYLAAISGIDAALFEAAEIDGANRLQQIWHVTLPMMRPTIIILMIMSVGKIMNADFGLFFNVTGDMPTLYSTVDVIDTYIYRALRQLGDVGISSATGFFQSVVSFALVLVCNKVANKVEEGSALF